MDNESHAKLSEERHRDREEAVAAAERLNRLCDDSARLDSRVKALVDAERLKDMMNDADRINSRTQDRAALDSLESTIETSARMDSRVSDLSAAEGLNSLVDEAEEYALSLEESIKVSEQAMAFRASLPADDPLSTKFRVMTYAEQACAKDEAIFRDWQRVLQDPPVVNDRTYDDIINVVDYKTELKGVHQFRYEATDDADDFQKNMLELYHGGFMCEGEDKAYRITRRIHGGPLFHYISNCKELKDLKHFMTELYGFWKETTKPYREALVATSSVSDASPTSAESVEHHGKVQEFCARISKADARTFTGDNANHSSLSCIYEMHRVADATEEDAANDAATVRQKIGKIHSRVLNLGSYFADSHKSRRKPFNFDGEDEAPPPAAVDGNVLCLIDATSSLFAKHPNQDLSNYLVEFVEVFATAALYPTIAICPSIDCLGDSNYQRDDARFFNTVQHIVIKIIDGKFRRAMSDQIRDEKKYSEEEWEELIKLTKWIHQNCLDRPSQNYYVPVNRKEYLEKIGFHRILKENTVQNIEWMKNLQDLRNHAVVCGFKKFPTKRLRDWVNKQRRRLGEGGDQVKTGELRKKNQWRVDLLNSINFPWQRGGESGIGVRHY
mmetsp:Transcript_29096/g.84557  ORF Transcript_29096/g.84557 Transcript_29096/m.84557 type:complete len:613 (+) Transcript_29096:96-1934(+)